MPTPLPDHLERILVGVKQAGDQWIASCPLHEDNTPSMTIRVLDHGTVVAKCHAGCDQRQLAEILHLHVEKPRREWMPDGLIHDQLRLPRRDGQGALPGGALHAEGLPPAHAMGGDLNAANFVLKIITQRCRILGFDKPEELTATPPRTVVIGGTSEEYIAGLKALIDERDQKADR